MDSHSFMTLLLFFSLFLGTFVQAQPIELLPALEMGVNISWQYDTVIPFPGADEPFQWRLGMTPTVPPANYKNMKWNLFNIKNSSFLLSEWRKFPANTRNSFVLTLAQDKALYNLLPSLDNYQVLISLDEKEIKYYISLGHPCQKYNGQFQDLTLPANKSCRAEKSQLPNSDQECSEWKRELESYDLSCVENKEMYESAKICGTYICQ